MRPWQLSAGPAKSVTDRHSGPDSYGLACRVLLSAACSRAACAAAAALMACGSPESSCQPGCCAAPSCPPP